MQEDKIQNGQEIIALWVGPHSQRAAHHFYALQAQQFFDQSEDPTNQHALWNFTGKDIREKTPRMIIFDTKSSHLRTLRNVNLKKIMKKMEEPTQNEMHFNFQFYSPQEQEKQEYNPDTYLYENWFATEDNYALIDRKLNQERNDFQLWESYFQFERDTYQDKIRKQLQRTDFLRMLTICSDSDKVGFTSKVLQYLKDECLKIPIMFTSLSEEKQKGFFQECYLPLMSQVAEEVNILVDIDIAPPQFPYFINQSFSHHIAPILNSLYTPLILKNSSCADYLQKIQSDKASIFNLAYTLPIITEQLALNQITNIFEYLPEQAQKKAQKVQNKQQERNRINFCNSTFLNYHEKKLGKKELKHKLQKVQWNLSHTTSESYVLKGHFNEFQQKFKQKVGKLQLKYLSGILASSPNFDLKYHSFYKQDYGDIVQNYPFHTVLFQHQSFGPSMRNYIAANCPRFERERSQDWRERAIEQADLYFEKCGEDSD